MIKIISGIIGALLLLLIVNPVVTQGQNPIVDLGAEGVRITGGGIVAMINTLVETIGASGGLLGALISIVLGIVNGFFSFILSLVSSSIVSCITSFMSSGLISTIMAVITSIVANLLSVVNGVVECASLLCAPIFHFGTANILPMIVKGLGTVALNTILTRVIKWVVAFVVLIVVEIIYEILALIYLIPIISCIGSFTQPVLFLLIVHPLVFGIPFIFVDSFTHSFNWLTVGGASECVIINGAWSVICTIIEWPTHIAYAILMFVPILNILVAIANFVIAGVGFVVLDITTIIFSLYLFIRNLLSSIAGDCAHILAGACSGLCGF